MLLSVGLGINSEEAVRYSSDTCSLRETRKRREHGRCVDGTWTLGTLIT